MLSKLTYLRGRYTIHLLSPTYKHIQWQTYAQQLTFSFGSLKNRVNLLIMKLINTNIVGGFFLCKLKILN